METIDGLRDLQIPPGIQPGETIKLPYMGAPNIKNPSIRGDHHFVVSIKIPKTIRFSPSPFVSMPSHMISKFIMSLHTFWLHLLFENSNDTQRSNGTKDFNYLCLYFNLETKQNKHFSCLLCSFMRFKS